MDIKKRHRGLDVIILFTIFFSPVILDWIFDFSWIMNFNAYPMGIIIGFLLFAIIDKLK